jgi:glycosyltransferase involved in cell wall biosynthesis
VGVETDTNTGKPLRITHFLPAIRLADGGVARAVLDWCKVFAARGHSVCLICNDPQDVPADWLRPGSGAAAPGLPRCVVVSLRGGPFRHLHALQSSSVELAVLDQTDILHLHTPWELGNIRFSRAARRLGIPYVVSIHGMLDDWSMSQRTSKKRLYLALLGRSLLNRAACVHCTAESELSQARKWFDSSKNTVLPYIVDLAPVANLPGPEAGLSLIPRSMRERRKVLFLSRLHEKKGIDVLLRAVARLRDAGLPVVLLVAGVGDASYDKKLREIVGELKLSDHVVFLGLVTGTEKISLYQAVDLLALPTQQENFGLVLTESMACGTPVVTTQGTDIWQEIQTAGAVITDRTPEAFAAAIEKLLATPEDLADRGRRGRDWVLSSLAVEPLSRRYEALYRQMSSLRSEQHRS